MLFCRCAGKKIHKELFSSSLHPSHREAMKSRYLEECRHHSDLRHPCIVQLVGLYTRPEDPLPMLVMECMHSTLTSCLAKHQDIPAHFKRRVLLDVSLGLRFLHERADPIVHRDLTANNVLVTEDLRAKISDLGMARIVPKDVLLQLTSAPGTIDYMPPEALMADPQYDTGLDMFSFGVLILHVMTQTWPTPHKPATSTDLVSGKLRAHSEVERRANYFGKMDLGDVLTILAERCLSNDTGGRPAAKEVVKELQTVMTSSMSSSCPLEAAGKEREARERRDALEEQARNVECQLHQILQDLRGRYALKEPDLDELTRQLQVVVRGTRSVLYSTSATTSSPTSYDPAQPRFIVSYKPSTSSSGGDTNQDPTLLHITSAAKHTPYPLFVTVRSPVNLTFSGTYVKTVLSDLKKPIGVAVSGDELYVVDNAGWKCVHVCNIEGDKEASLRSFVDSSSKVDLSGALEKCWYPSGVAVDTEKNVILVDTYSHRVVKFGPDGTYLASTGKFSESGSELGEFDKPMGVTVAANGDLYVCDRSNHRIQVLGGDMVSRQSFGSHGKGPCEFHHPWDLAFDSKGNIYVVDCSNYCVKVYTKGFESFLRQIGKEGTGEGDFQGPSSICIDASDYVYVSDMRCCCVKVFSPSGEFVMRLGSSRHERPEFCLNKPMGVALDGKGRLFVSDSYNGRVLMYE